MEICIQRMLDDKADMIFGIEEPLSIGRPENSAVF
jgi:hypothetical protein